MVDNPKTPEDFDALSDEDFMNLDPDNFSGDIPNGETSLTSEENHVEEYQGDNSQTYDNENNQGMDSNQSSPDNSDDVNSPDNDPNASENQEGEDPEVQGGTGIDPMAEAANQAASNEENNSSEDNTEANQQPESNSQEEGQNTTENKVKSEPVKNVDFKLPDGMSSEQATAALAFASIVMAPFKADGKDFTVRSPEDAIKLMQQGVNYSRRMEELKPMKAMNRMLQDHGLDDVSKMSFLIDLSKGDKNAILKLLKDNNMDPMDLDIEKDSGYQARNYSGDPQDNAFRDALDTAKVTPEGQALISDIHSKWDDASKVRLRENPSILGNLTELKQSGVYEQVEAELAYQRSMGYLIHTPYLEAFDQVGEAMKNAGVLTVKQPAPTANFMGQLSGNTQQQVQPVAQGARKVPAQKKAAPNPHLSSTPLSKQSSNSTPTPDFDKMSDEDFLKMPPPS